MRIITSATYIWSDKQSRPLLVQEKSITRTGEFAYCKGATSAQDQLSQEEANYYQVATSQATQQFAQQQAIQNTLQAAANPIIAKGPSQQGYSAGQMAELNASVIQGTGQQYANAAKSVREAQAAQGGGTQFLPSGVNSQINADLAASAANQASSGLTSNIQNSYAAGALQYVNAENSLMGVGGLTNASAFSNSATNAAGAANTEANAVQTADQEATNNIMGLATGAMGATGALLMGKCWVAAELYGGWEDPRTIALRRYIFGEYSKSFRGKIFASLYLKFGERVAKHIKTHPISRWFAQKIFDRLLVAATNKDRQVNHVSLAH